MMYRGSKIAVAVVAAIAVIAASSPAEAKKKRTRVSAEARSALFYGSRRNGGGVSDFGDTLRSGWEAGVGVSVDHYTGRGKISLDGSTTKVNYFSDKYRDRWSNRVALGYEHDMGGGLSLGVRGAYTTQMLGLEYDKFNQSELRSIVGYDVGPNRFRVGGGYRWRTYRDGFDTNGRGFFLDADYRYKLTPNSSIMLDLGYDEINADIANRNYRRFTVTPSYSFSITPNTDVTLSSRWRTWTYDNRYVGLDKRKDSSIQPMVEVSHQFAKDWYVDAGAGYRWRWTNQPGSDEQGPRLQIGIRKRFGLN